MAKCWLRAARPCRKNLQNLDNLHTRVGIIMSPDAPSFTCTEITASGLHLHYYSHRRGLADMVVGLIQGLGKMFGNETEITHIEDREAGADHDVFRIAWS